MALASGPVGLSFSAPWDGAGDFNEVRGVITSDGDQLVFTPSEYRQHELSLYSDGAISIMAIGEWMSAWVAPTPEYPGAEHEALAALFAPLLESGAPIDLVAEIELDGLAQQVTYTAVNETTATVTIEDLVFEATFDAPEGGFSFPDPAEVGLMPEDISGSSANPITVTWIEATADQ